MFVSSNISREIFMIFSKMITVKSILNSKELLVSDDQRPYHWNLGLDEGQVMVGDYPPFSGPEIVFQEGIDGCPLYFGHFIFKQISEDVFEILDGQRRLTTIYILLFALFDRLEQLNKSYAVENYQDLIFEREMLKYHLHVVSYDNDFLQDYVVRRKVDQDKFIYSLSKMHIANAFDGFSAKIKKLPETKVCSMIKGLLNANCTKSVIHREKERMFLSLMNSSLSMRSNSLDKIRMRFLYVSYILAGGGERDSLMQEINERFKQIYFSIYSTNADNFMDEERVLSIAVHVCCEILENIDPLVVIYSELSGKNPLHFIRRFMRMLSCIFKSFNKFKDELELNVMKSEENNSLFDFNRLIPVLMKGYIFGLSWAVLNDLYKGMKVLVCQNLYLGETGLILILNDVFRKIDEKNTDIISIAANLK